MSAQPRLRPVRVYTRPDYELKDGSWRQQNDCGGRYVWVVYDTVAAKYMVMAMHGEHKVQQQRICVSAWQRVTWLDSLTRRVPVVRLDRPSRYQNHIRSRVLSMMATGHWPQTATGVVYVATAIVPH